MAKPTEARIVISGVELNDAQSMALRVAASSYYMEMQDPNALGEDEHGIEMTKLYGARLKEILALITRGVT